MKPDLSRHSIDELHKLKRVLKAMRIICIIMTIAVTIAVFTPTVQQMTSSRLIFLLPLAVGSGLVSCRRAIISVNEELLKRQ